MANTLWPARQGGQTQEGGSGNTYLISAVTARVQLFINQFICLFSTAVSIYMNIYLCVHRLMKWTQPRYLNMKETESWQYWAFLVIGKS